MNGRRNESAIRLAVVTTHPIQYLAPVFAELASRPEIELRVFYGWRGALDSVVDRGFGQSFAWDIPLLEGYQSEFVDNHSKDVGSHNYAGIDLPTLNQQIEKWGPDAVLVYGWRYKAHWSAIKYFSGKVPVFFRGDSTQLDKRSFWRQILRKLTLTYVYRNVDIAFSVGACNRNYFLANGLKSNQIIHAPHSVDNDRFSSTGFRAGNEIREKLGIAEDEISMLYCGKLERIKGPDLLFDAIKSCDLNNTHLIIAGSGSLENSLKRQGLRNIHFMGFQNQSEIPSLYHAADVLVFPSRSDSWGLAINEAMACGCAIIASDRAGAAIDLVKQGENGWIYNPDRPGELVNAINEATSMGRRELARYGEQSKILIKDWSIQAQVDKIVEGVQKFSPKS